jgi:hypothetical protein
MVSVKFKVNGREVAAGQFGSALEAALFKSVGENIQKKLGQVRCETHGQAPKITVSGTSLKDLKFGISGCCQGLKDKVLLLLK